MHYIISLQMMVTDRNLQTVSTTYTVFKLSKDASIDDFIKKFQEHKNDHRNNAITRGRTIVQHAIIDIEPKED